MAAKHGIPDTYVAGEEIARELGLTDSEYAHIRKELGRQPTYAEAGIFSAMYSEHCSYKSSKHALRRFPTTGKQVVQGPGENAGIVDIGGGWGVAFKMESHNHPSYIEPYQGAATGVGGILRDVFTMGARPIASMNSLCFGDPDLPKTRSLVKGVVRGIGDYGNSVGVPTVAGQTFFHPCYNGNCLVNAFTAGLVRLDEIFRGYASGIGNPVVYVGAKTGRDGVHGATMASKEFSTEEEPDRPTVQVGDPFTEKLLLEATLEAMKKGLIIGIQDMGAAGLTSSSFEMAHRAGTGLEVDLDRIPTREQGMTAYELLLSESQERMLLVTEEDRLPALREVFEKWDLHAEVIGRVVEGDRVRMTKGGEQVVDIPVDLVVNPPPAERPLASPAQMESRWAWETDAVSSRSWEEKFNLTFSGIDFADPTPLVEQYDSMVGNRTTGPAFSDGATLRLRDLGDPAPELALSVDCNPRVVWLWPREGGRRAVAEAALNLACRGARPLAITDCLNFGSPQNPEVMWQFEESIEGISEACRALDTPVVSGNVSFYNDTDGKPIHPTPMIGMVGKKEPGITLPRAAVEEPGWDLYLLGRCEGELGGSRFLSRLLGRDAGKPSETDLAEVGRCLEVLLNFTSRNVPAALHDISDGGLAVAAAEFLLPVERQGLGLDLDIPESADADRFLWGESLPRVLVACPAASAAVLKEDARRKSIELTAVGRFTDSGTLRVRHRGRELASRSLTEVRKVWRQAWTPLFE